MVSDAGLSVVVIETVNEDNGLAARKRVERRRLTNLRLQASVREAEERGRACSPRGDRSN